MNLQEIIEQKDYWYLKDNKYIIDSNWVYQYKQSAPYPAFIWWNDYKFRTPRLYFNITIREHTKDKMINAKTNIGKFKYTVTIAGAISSIPLPIEIWEYNDNPWHGMNMYIDCFHFGEKYKHLEEEYIGKKPGTSSTLIKGFYILDEAIEFAEMWKTKAIEDHKKIIEEDKEIIKILI